MNDDIDPTRVMRVLKAAAYNQSLTMRPPQPPQAMQPRPATDRRGTWLLGLLCPHCGSPCLPAPDRPTSESDTHREVYVRCGGCGSVLLVAIRLTTITRGDGHPPRGVPDDVQWDRTAPGAGAVAAILAADNELGGVRRRAS